MSLDMLLEAAKYVENHTPQVQARAESPPEIIATFSRRKSHTSAKPTPSAISSQQQNVVKSHSASSHHNSYSLYSSQHNSLSSSSSSHSRSHHQDYYGQSYSQHDDLRDKRRSGGLFNSAGTREVHNKLEKNRRAHLKECFEMLKRQLPTMDERKTSNLSILRGALRYIQVLKRKEREYEHEMEKLAREKIASQQKLASLKKGMSSQVDHIDISRYLPVDQDNETTTTASECGALSDPEDDPIGPVRQISRMNRIPIQSLHPERRPSSTNDRPVSPDSSSSTSSASSEGIPDGVGDNPSVSASSFFTPSSSASTFSGKTSQLATKFSKELIAESARSSSPKTEVKEVPATVPTMSISLPNPTQAKSLPSHSSTTLPATRIHFAGATTVRSAESSIGLTVPSIKTRAIAYQGAATPSSGGLQLGNVTGVLAAGTPHTLQVINQGQVKVIAAPTQNGPLRLYSPVAVGPNTTLAMMAPNTVAKLGQQSFRFATQNNNTAVSKNTVVTPVTLVTSSAMVNVSGKPVIFSGQGLTVDQTARVVATAGKAGTTLALAANPKGQQYPTVGSNGLTYVQPKMASHILQAVSQKALSQTLVNAGVGQSGVTNLGRQLITTAIKPGTNTATIRAPITQLSRVTQLVSQPSIGQIVNSGNQGAGTLQVGSPITMVPAQQLNKVLTNSPILKTVNSVPLLQQQLQLQTSGSGSSTIKPVMVVSVPNVNASSGSQGVATAVSLKQ